MLAAEAVARAKPDGYTLFAHLQQHPFRGARPVQDRALRSDQRFHPDRADRPLSLIHRRHARSADQVDGRTCHICESNPGKLSASFGHGTGQITIGAMRKRLTIDILPVAYRSNPMAVTDLMAGHVQIGVPDFSTGIPHVKAGKIRPLAVLTKQRDAIPAGRSDLGRNRDARLRPARLPACSTGRQAAKRRRCALKPIEKARATAKCVTLQRRRRRTLLDRLPAGFADYVKTELVKWTALIKEAGIEPE